MTIKNLDKIELNFKIKSFKLRDEFKISRISKKSIQVIDISLTKNRITVLSECIPYARYNENMEDVLGYLNRNKSKIEDILKENKIKKIPYLCLQNTLSSAMINILQRENKKKIRKTIKKIITSVTIPIFSLEKTKKILQKFTKTKIIKIKLNEKEVIPKLCLIRQICPKSKIIIDANESWSKKFLKENIKNLEPFNILLIEQPFPQGKDYYLKNIQSKLKFCADESFHMKNKNLIRDIKYYDCVNLKLDKFGTHEQILKYISIAKKAKKIIMLGCMVSSSLSIYPTLRYFRYCDYFDLDGPYFLKKDRLDGITYRNGLAEINS
jgi:hypothetical protein